MTETLTAPTVPKLSRRPGDIQWAHWAGRLGAALRRVVDAETPHERAHATTVGVEALDDFDRVLPLPLPPGAQWLPCPPPPLRTDDCCHGCESALLATEGVFCVACLVEEADAR